MAPTSTVVTPITTMTDTAALQSARLLQLCSANLPVGGFSFSQGLEQAVERGWIDSAEALHDWLRVFLQTSVSHTDLPLLGAQYDAVSSGCSKTFEEQDAWVAATRESAEILLAEQAMGKALKRLLNNLSDKPTGVAAVAWQRARRLLYQSVCAGCSPVWFTPQHNIKRLCLDVTRRSGRCRHQAYSAGSDRWPEPAISPCRTNTNMPDNKRQHRS